MPQDTPKFSQEQWEFLAAIEALGQPVHIRVAGELVPLKPGPFLQLIRTAKALGWLEETEADTYCLSRDLPERIKARLKEISNPEFLARLLKRVDQLGLSGRLNPASLSGLLRRAGRDYEAAVLENDLAQTAIQENDFVSASNHIEEAVSCLSRLRGQPEAEALFVSAVLDLSNLRLRLGRNLDGVPTLLRDARDAAEELGDRRSRALADLYMGRFSYFSYNLDDALSALVSGLDEVEELGDEDILAQSAEFVGLYYFLQGMYREAIKHFERAMLSAHSKKRGPFSAFLSYTFGYCAAYLGLFNQAIGIFNYNWLSYRKKSEPSPAALFRSALGITLLMAGKKRQALHHLQGAYEESRCIQNSRSLLLAQAGLSYFHFLEGRIEESRRILFQSVNEAAEADFAVRQYSFPWILEQYYEFQQSGSSLQAPYFSFDREIDRIISGPNIHLRGVAHRILAKEAMSRSDEWAAVRSNLETSERYLKRSGNPVELAKTRAMMAQVELKAGDRAKAASLACKARAGISVSDESLFPDEIKVLIGEKAGQPAARVRVEVIERLLEMMEDFIPSTNLDELLSRVAAVSAKFHGAESCGLFWFPDPNSDRDPELRATYNLSPEEVKEPGFRANLKMITQAFRRNKPLVARREAGSEDDLGLDMRTALCLPFEVSGRVQGVLYHTNSYIGDGFDIIDPTVLQRISRQMGAYIERIWEYSRLMEKKMVMTAVRFAPMEREKDKQVITQDRGMIELLSQAERVADSEASILILGETGVGKGLLAQRLHEMSPRSRGPFVVVDLTTIPETLVESELFGHEKGAFTGADRQKQGRIELAHQGTLFIDEVGETPWFVQTKLLRVIQDKSFVRIGGTRALVSDFRLLVATNRNLAEEVSSGRFREDLFYRLNVVPITIPPLRERGQDMVLLARHFLNYYAWKHKRPGLELSPEDEAALTGYHWPGNVRELQNVIERAVLLAKEGRVELTLPRESKALPADPFFDTPTADELFRRYLNFILQKTGGKLSGPGGAAQLLGMKRTTLYSRMKKLGLA
ncbi:MAG: sigma-54-dependent Fis family transcriptional regulator [Deltaproteobacteria bacterium]|nr:sigma-54-dependent Fis family transcriptional regulator [Deltaproteobacteria bacterium]